MSFASGNRLATSFPNDCGCGFIPNPNGEAMYFPTEESQAALGAKGR